MDCASGRLWIELTNAGRASVHFALYPNNYRSGPWQYDVGPNGFAIDSFLVSTNPSGVYDLTCYGPKGFHRRFAGSLGRNCGQLEVSSSLDLEAGGLNVILTNSAPVPVAVTVSNALQAGDTRSYTLSPDSTMTDLFLAVTNSQGRYDLTATTEVDPLFVRRFAGHIETGPPRIREARVGGQLQLSYPGWAAGYTLETLVDLTTGLWQPVSSPAVVLNNRVFVTVPPLAQTAYFRLRR
jgi:phospholipase C